MTNPADDLLKAYEGMSVDDVLRHLIAKRCQMPPEAITDAFIREQLSEREEEIEVDSMAQRVRDEVKALLSELKRQSFT